MPNLPNRRRVRLGIGLILVLLLCASCSSTRVGAIPDPLALFPPEATWAWNLEANRVPDSEFVRALRLEPMIREAAADLLARRGYVEATDGSEPEYLLSYDIGAGRRISHDESEGAVSLALNLVQANTGDRVWMGFTHTFVDVSRPDAERWESIRDFIETMLEDFPPGH